jgi:hypothetical protein
MWSLAKSKTPLGAMNFVRRSIKRKSLFFYKNNLINMKKGHFFII